MADLTNQFIDALHRTEETRDVDPLVSLFAEDAELSSGNRHEHDRGLDGARTFWQHYLSAFADVRSEFTNVREADGMAVLEWKSIGHLPDGQPLTYEGVSILETDGGKLKRFKTYYDSAPFLPNGSKHKGDA